MTGFFVSSPGEVRRHPVHALPVGVFRLFLHGRVQLDELGTRASSKFATIQYTVVNQLPEEWVLWSLARHNSARVCVLARARYASSSVL